MNYYTIQPRQRLAEYVRYFWVLEGEVINDIPYVHRSMANSCPELFFHYQGVFEEWVSPDKWTSSFPSGLHGQSQQISRFRINQSFGLFGAYLYPYTIPLIFNIPASELSNQIPDLVSLLGQEGKDLEEKIMTCGTNHQRTIILSDFLEARLQKNSRDRPTVFSSINYILQRKGSVNIEKLSSDYFLSSRQFERKFKEFSGFAPKLYSRIVRFQSALMEYGNKHKSLTDIAYECGYYDQSHFIHEFKEFSGHHPKSYFHGRAEGTEWRG